MISLSDNRVPHATCFLSVLTTLELKVWDISRQGSRLTCGHKRASFANLQDSKSPPPGATPSHPYHLTPRPTKTKESFLKDQFMSGRGHGSQNQDTKKPSTPTTVPQEVLFLKSRIESCWPFLLCHLHEG